LILAAGGAAWAAPKASVKFPVGVSSATGRARSEWFRLLPRSAGGSIHPERGFPICSILDNAARGCV